jgi:hypothetical protein
MNTDEELLTRVLDRAAGQITAETPRPLAEPAGFQMTWWPGKSPEACAGPDAYPPSAALVQFSVDWRNFHLLPAGGRRNGSNCCFTFASINCDAPAVSWFPLRMGREPRSFGMP